MDGGESENTRRDSIVAVVQLVCDGGTGIVLTTSSSRLKIGARKRVDRLNNELNVDAGSKETSIESSSWAFG